MVASFMKTIRQTLIILTETFRQNQILLPDRQAEDLLGDLLNCSRQKLYLNGSRYLSESEWECCQDRLRKRLQGVPLQYLHGQVEFYDCLIKVNSHVLIPRPETEILVDKIVQTLKGKNLTDQVLCDLCCGSGCIGIALKKRFPNLKVVASDLSFEATEMTKVNAKENQVQITVDQGDLFESFKNQKMHYFVCNPPYISLKEYIALERDVLDYEPRQALLAGETGLEFYQRLAAQLPDYLFSFGRVWLEIGYDQGKAVKQLFQGSSWENQKVEKDWAGHDRFFSCQFRGSLKNPNASI